MKYIFTTVLLLIVIFAGAFAVLGQETETRVVDEVVAQVNDGVITLSRIKRESKLIVDEQVKAGKSREEAQKMVDEKQGEMIANLINEELLLQRAKELGLDSQVDASVNERFVQIMKQYNMKNLDALYKNMEEQGVDPAEIRDAWRKQATREIVIQREVQSKEYWRPSSKELRDYFEKNKARFTKPETVSLSEIFLNFAGREETATREKAKQLVAQLKGGADFAKLQKENPDPGVVTRGTGKIEKADIADFPELITNAIRGRNVGEYTNPIEAPDLGMIILRIDAHEQASSESFFDENAVRMAILTERAPTATKEFMTNLRHDSYIKIGEAYRPLVSPILFAEDRKEKSPPKPEEAKAKNPTR